MTTEEMRDYLVKNNPNTDVKFLRCGSDSHAFKVGEYIYRFPHGDASFAQYKKEAQLCDFLRGAISVPIPSIEVHDGAVRFARHKMIIGRSWHWHALALTPIRQARLARGIAKFFAELHGVNISAFNIESERVAYVQFDKIADKIAPFLSKHQMQFFKKEYNKIVNKPVAKRDIVMCHMGLKGSNSVIDKHGNLIGVFDFGNAGSHERWRDISVVRMGGNKWLYRMVLRHYERLTGVRCDRARIADLGTIEQFSYKRWFDEDGAPRNLDDRKIKKYLAKTLVRFYHLPKCFKHFLYLMMTIHKSK